MAKGTRSAGANSTWKVDRRNGTSYRSPDGKTLARLINAKYRATCEFCGKAMNIGDDILAVPPMQPLNLDTRWLMFCLDCAQDSVFERTGNYEVNLAELFPVRDEI